MSSYEYWLISAPGDKTCQQTFDKLNQVSRELGLTTSHLLLRLQATNKQQLSTNWKFPVPDLKVNSRVTI